MTSTYTQTQALDRVSVQEKPSPPINRAKALGGSILRLLPTAIEWIALFSLIGWSIVGGLELRRWTWDQTVPIRFSGDILNGFMQGSRVYDLALASAADEKRPMAWRDFYDAYRATYTNVVENTPMRFAPNTIGKNYGLDYAPGRLMIMALWTKWLRDQNLEWDNSYQTTWPLLTLNTVCEAVSALAIWALVRHWRRNQNQWSIWPDWKNPRREWPAVLAGLAAWFNPAIIWNAHAWPQWDVWLLPFYLLGLLAMCKNRWLLAGFVTMIGVTLKGQVLLVLPVVIAWPIFAGKPLAAVRFIIGGALVMALMALPWMIYTTTAKVWLISMMLICPTCVFLLHRRKSFDRYSFFTAVVCAIAIACSMYRPAHWALYWMGLISIAITAVAPRWLPRRWLLPVIAAQAAIAIFAAGLAFGGSFDWYEVSYSYPQRHGVNLVISGANFCRILYTQFGWEKSDLVALPAWLPQITIRTFLILLYSVCLTACALAAALHARRRSPRFLMAMAVPWVVMFAIVPQMHERYLVWGAVVMCAGVGISVSDALLAVAVTFFAWLNMAQPMFIRNGGYWPLMTEIMAQVGWHHAYALVLLSTICLYAALLPDRKLQEITPNLPQ